MKGITEVVITLSPELWREMRRQAAALDVPVEWLAAGLVCDTIEEQRGIVSGRMFASRVARCYETSYVRLVVSSWMAFSCIGGSDVRREADARHAPGPRSRR